ncbi:pyridoxal-phosphate dependent enzyme [Nonomuraea sp. NPDC050663]|uniref:pyridoxal-phosphate dependent enzyme n=1 Tax=Nonomuraea sp. NPDC050663 TaxID=3364370 RepID=UPI0037ADFEBA
MADPPRREPGAHLTWRERALAILEPGDPTPLIALPGGRVLLKDESRQPTGTLRHRHARILFRNAVVDGLVTEGTTVIEAAGGNAAVAQAWFAQRLGLAYVAVMPGAPSPERARPVEELGGRVRFVTPPLAIYDEARRLAEGGSAHYLDQFGRAAPHDLGDELAGQIDPAWVVVGANTGATSASLAAAGLRVAVADPENSAYFPGWTLDAPDYATGMPSRIEGIGRPRVEPGFDFDAVRLVIPVADDESLATARWIWETTGIPAGPSSGTALRAALKLAERGGDAGRGGDARRGGDAGRIEGDGPIVTIVGDAHPRHIHRYPESSALPRS